jgi:phenylacetic acid degradation operon negative regulatory protein
MNKSRAKELLIGLLKFGGLLTITVVMPGATPVIEKLFLKDKKFDKREFNRTINRLEDIGMIEKLVNGDELTIKLKPKGTKQATEYALDDIEIKRPARWDNKWRIVMFDIPENKKIARNAFKRHLDRLGFAQIQKSVYVHPFPCDKEIEYIVGVYALKQFIKYAIADYFNDQNDLIKKYRLVQ